MAELLLKWNKVNYSDFIRIVLLRQFTTINSTNNKNHVYLGTKNSITAGKYWVNILNENFQWRPASEIENDNEEDQTYRGTSSRILQNLPHYDYHEARDSILSNTNLFLKKIFQRL